MDQRKKLVVVLSMGEHVREWKAADNDGKVFRTGLSTPPSEQQQGEEIGRGEERDVWRAAHLEATRRNE